LDPIRRWQLFVSRLARRTDLATTRIDDLDADAREAVYERGRKHIQALAERIESQTGFTLESNVALDFGCGIGKNVLALAQRCERVYGLDISPAVLAEAERNAKRLHIENVEWMDAARLEELSGRYDLVVSFFVFQHIASREGERIFATLVRGLRPRGVGAIHLTLRPGLRRVGRSYMYNLMNSYSLNRISKLLADEGITEWHAKMHGRPLAGAPRPVYDEVTLLFRKD
jgi:cyclopropane fatty-acyl-phospholipid synthase-like methyltransferase